MQRNTSTVFGELRQGDRFYFVSDAKKVVHEITVENLIAKSKYNQVDPFGKKAWTFDKEGVRTTPVIFLRHTRPSSGDGWVLGELEDGDIFYLQEDLITEYLVIKNRHGKVYVNTSTNLEKEIDHNKIVVFVKKREVIKAI
jgi:hypothetical protein